MKRKAVFTFLFLPMALFAAQLDKTYAPLVPAPTKNAVATPVKMFEHVSLNEVKSVSAMFDSAMMDTTDVPATSLPAKYECKTDENGAVTNMIVSFEAYLGEYSKCVVLELSQGEDGIYGRVLTRRWSTQHDYVIGTDPKNWPKGSDIQNYHLRNVKIFDTDDSFLRTTLWWNGGGEGVWDCETANWLDEDGVACAWTAGARACFTNDVAATIAVGEGVSASCILAYGRSLTFTGQPLTMIGSAETVMRTGRVRFECPIAGTDGFRVVNLLYKNLLGDNVLFPTDETLILKNASIEGVSALYATPAGTYINVEDGVTDARSYHVQNDGTTLTAQMQFYDVAETESWTKCVMVELWQEGNDVYGKWTAAYYDNAHKFVDVRGRDFSSGTDRSTKNAKEYNIGSLRIGARVELAGANTFTGLLRAEGYTTIALDGGTLCGGVFNDPVALPMSVLEVSHTRQRFNKNVISQKNDTNTKYPFSLIVKGSVDPSKNAVRTYSGNLTGTKVANNQYLPQTLFNDVDASELSGWVNMEAKFGIDAMGDAQNGDAQTAFFWNDGTTVKAQFKIADDMNEKYPAGGLHDPTSPSSYRPYVKAAVYEFSHDGADIVAKRINSIYNGDLAEYINNPVDFFSADLYDFYIAKRVYGCHSLKVTVSNVSDTVVTLAATNVFQKGYITVDGAFLAIASSELTASNYYNSVNVKNGGKLFFTDKTDSLKNAKATVDGEGSRLSFCRPGSLATTSTLDIRNGATLVVEGGSLTNAAKRLSAKDFNWCSRLTLTGGTTLTGGASAVGASATALTVTNGTLAAAARIAQPLYIKGNKNTVNSPLVLAVTDVTQSDAVDLFIDGQLRDSDDDDPRALKKTGTGTVQLGASNKRTPALYKDADNYTRFGTPNAYSGTLMIADGKVVLGADEALDSMAGVEMCGGALDVGGKTTAAGTLMLTQDAEILLNGGTLTFADSSACDWGTCTLAITGTGSVSFGTGAKALTAAQLASIRLNGKRVELAPSGQIRERSGFRVIVF